MGDMVSASAPRSWSGMKMVVTWRETLAAAAEAMAAVRKALESMMFFGEGGRFTLGYSTTKSSSRWKRTNRRGGGGKEALFKTHTSNLPHLVCTVLA
jgi:hypothetical protein